MALLRSYLAMLPRLHAEDQLDRFHGAVAARSLRFEAGVVKRYAGELARAAEGLIGRPKAAPANPEALAAMGITVVIEPAHV